MQVSLHPKWLLYFSMVVYAISLTQVGFCTNTDCSDTDPGIWLLILGSFGFFLSPAGFTWLANPALFISWGGFSNQPKGSAICSSVAVALSASFLFFDNIVADEAGNYHNIISYGRGYWLWLSSTVILLGAHLLKRFRTH